MPSLGRILERLTVAVDGDTSDAERKLHGLSDEGRGGSWIGKLGGAAARAGGLMAVGIGAGAAAMGTLGLAAGAQAEQSNIAFTSIMGDAGKAKAFLADLNTFAAQTPFELPGLRDSASQMLAVGVNAQDVIPIMRTLGDSTSAMGTGADGINRAVMALTQMQVKGKVTGEEMLQLAEAGVPAWDALATKMGVSVPEAQAKVSAGQVQVNTLMSAIETSAGPALTRVKGMMDKQSASLIGLWSTLKDTVGQGLGQMMGPAIKSIEGQLPAVTSTIGASLALIGPQVSTMMSGAVGLLGDLLPAVAPLLGAVAQALGESFKTLGPALAQLGPPLLRVFEALLPVLPAMANGLVALVPALIPLINGFARLLELIPPNVLAAIVAGFMLFGPITTIFSALGAVLPLVAVGFELLLGPVGLVVLAVAALAAAGYLIYRNWDTIAAFLDRTWEWIKTTFMHGVDAVGGFLGGLVDFVVSIPSRIWNGLTSLPGMLVGLGSELIRGLWRGASGMFGQMWGWLTSLPGEVVRSVGDLGQLLVASGKNVVVGLWNGIAGMGSWLWDKIVGWARAVIPGPVARALGMASPSKVMAWHGQMAAAGLAEGILGSAGTVASAAGVLARAAQPSLAGSFATSGSVAGGGGSGGQTVEVVVSMDGMRMSWAEAERRLRVLFVDSGGRNAFAAATG